MQMVQRIEARERLLKESVSPALNAEMLIVQGHPDRSRQRK